MKGDIPAAVAFKNRYPAFLQHLGRRQQILRLSVAAKGDHRRMLNEQQHIADSLLLAESHQALLQAKPDSIVQGLKTKDRDHLVTGSGTHALIAKPYTLFDASSIASAKVGW